MRAVTTGLIRDGQENELALLHTLDVPLADSQFRRVDLVVGGVDRGLGVSKLRPDPPVPCKISTALRTFPRAIPGYSSAASFPAAVRRI